MRNFYLNKEGTLITEVSSGEQKSIEEFYSGITAPKIALIDRDGVVNEKAPSHHYILSPDQVKLLPGAREAMAYLSERRIPIVLITNQQGVAKGQLTLQDLVSINELLQEMIGTTIDAVFICPHLKEDGCECRKPKPGMVNAALKYFNADRSASVMFGDSESDIASAKNTGVLPIYVATRHDEYEEAKAKIKANHPEIFQNSQFDDLLSAVRSVF